MKNGLNNFVHYFSITPSSSIAIIGEVILTKLKYNLKSMVD